MIGKNPVYLHEIERAKRILEEIRDKLKAAGQEIATFDKHDIDELIEFDIMSGLSVFNHGSLQTDIRCIACPVHPSLQYEFIIEDLKGETHRPIGSVCILKRSLGEEQAEEYGRKLQQAASAYFRPIRKKKDVHQVELSLHEQEHRRIRQETGSVRAYLAALGLDWLPMAQLQGDAWVSLNQDDRAAVQALLSKNRHFSEPDFKRFVELNQRRNEQMLSGKSLSEERASRADPPAQTMVRKVQPTTPHPKKRNYDKLQYEQSPQPLSEEEWTEYLKHIKRDYNSKDWALIAPYISGDNMRRIQGKYKKRIPLNFRDLANLTRAWSSMTQSVNYTTQVGPRARTQPLGDSEVFQQFLPLLLERLKNDGYREERELFLSIGDKQRWSRKYLSRVLEKVRRYEIDYLSTPDLLITVEAINRKHDWDIS